MRKTGKIIIWITLAWLCFSGCKKYKEDPFISFTKPEKRFYGTWEVENLYENMLVRTKDYQDSCGCQFNFINVLNNQMSYPVLQNCINGKDYYGSGRLGNKYKNLYLELSGSMAEVSFGPFIPGNLVFEIRRLYNNTMIIGTVYKDNSYKIILKRIEKHQP